MQKFSHSSLIVAFLISGCATSFAPPETAIPLTRGPHAIAVADGDEVRLQQLFIRGLIRAMVDDHRQAIFLFEQAIQIDGSQPAIMMALAESHTALDELDTAIYYASQATRLDRDNRSYTVYLAELLHRNGNAEESLTLLQDWRDGHQDDVDALFRIAELHAELGRQEQALEIYLGLVDRPADEMKARRRMLELYNGLGNLEGMRSTVRRMLSIDSADNSLRRLLSEIYVELDSTMNAIELLEESIADDPTDNDTVILLSKLYRTIGRDSETESMHGRSKDIPDRPVDTMALASDLYARSISDVAAAQRAEELFSSMLNQGLETPDVLYMLGDLKYRNEEYLLAAPLLLRAAQKEPRRMDSWSQAAVSFLNGGDPQRALAVAEEALVLFPGHSALLRVAGQASVKTGRPEEALAFAATALEVIGMGSKAPEEDITEIRLLQAAAYRVLGLPEEAEKTLRLAIGNVPDNVELQYWLVMSLLDQEGRRADARVIAESGLHAEPEHPRLLDAMGWIEHLDGNDQIALKWLQRSVSANPQDAWSLEHLGDVYAGLGDVDAARENWERALAISRSRVELQVKLEQHP